MMHDGPDTSQDRYRGDVDNGKPILFEFCGDTPEECEAVRERMLKSVRGELTEELHANAEDFEEAGIVFEKPPARRSIVQVVSEVSKTASRRVSRVSSD